MSCVSQSHSDFFPVYKWEIALLQIKRKGEGELKKNKILKHV